MNAAPTDHSNQAITVEEFSQATGREAYNLSERPDLLWQQLYNRLQWEDEPLPQRLGPELAHRSADGAHPWLKTRTPFRESSALIRTLSDHTEWVGKCVFSPDGSMLASASSDHTVRLWDVASGREPAMLASRGPLRCAALAPFEPAAGCGDGRGGVHSIRLVGVEYGPVVLTATDLGEGIKIHCRHCNTSSPFQDAWLDQQIPCPNEACGTPLKVNPFVVERRS